jgi:hypothetical protein
MLMVRNVGAQNAIIFSAYAEPPLIRLQSRYRLFQWIVERKWLRAAMCVVEGAS